MAWVRVSLWTWKVLRGFSLIQLCEQNLLIDCMWRIGKKNLGNPPRLGPEKQGAAVPFPEMGGYWGRKRKDEVETVR